MKCILWLSAICCISFYPEKSVQSSSCQNSFTPQLLLEALGALLEAKLKTFSRYVYNVYPELEA